MRLKKVRILLFVFASLFASQLFAMWDGHFLLGAQMGAGTRDADLNMNITHPAPLGVTATVRKHDDTGFIWAFLAGYEWVHNEFLVGIEGNIGGQDFGDTKTYSFPDNLGNRYNASASFNRKIVTSLSLRGGYRLSPWIMAYMRLGAETSRDVIRFKSSYGGGPGPVLAVDMDDGQRGARLLAGFGFEFPLIYNTVIRLEYNYSSRGKGASHDQVASDRATVFSGNIKPVQHALFAAFVWNFNPLALVRESS